MTRITTTFDDTEWALVKREPDAVMCEIGVGEIGSPWSGHDTAKRIYQAMLSASPQPEPDTVRYVKAPEEMPGLDDALICYDAVNGCVTTPGQMHIIVQAAKEYLRLTGAK